jgi:hypothetical protein
MIAQRGLLIRSVVHHAAVIAFSFVMLYTSLWMYCDAGAEGRQ